MVQDERCPRRIRERDVLQPNRCLGRRRRDQSSGTGGDARLVEQREHSLRDREAACACVKLGCEVPERQVELWCEHENRQACLKPEISVGEPDADRHRNESDPQRGRELQDRAGEKPDAQRRHRRPAVTLARCRDRSRLRLTAVEGAQRRQAPNDVQEVHG